MNGNGFSIRHIDQQTLNIIADVYQKKFDTLIDIDNDILAEIDMKIDEYLKENKEASMYKRASCIIYWVKKLKPLRFLHDKKFVVKKTPYYFLNEACALIHGYLTLMTLKKKEERVILPFHPKFIKDFAVQLRYNFFSHAGLEMILAAQYQNTNEDAKA
ncbi:MAG: hypothetical protein B0D92_07620 [Spirochaeta sp. LUC14_002_19_P3]|nr:MAG: hypothetical protein B0D92_07620 [Spirochaeta sp. LUC14_002_19_P3]